MRRLATASLIFLGLSQAGHCQALPSLSTPAKGDTVNMSVQNGSRSSLSFGSSTSFGSSVSLTATEGTTTSANSSLAPSVGTLNFSIGGGGTPGTTSAKIDNLRAQGGGSTQVAGSPINVTDNNAQFSSGNATLTGVAGNLQITLDPTKTGFSARSNTLHSSYGANPGQDGAQLKNTSQNSNASGSANVTTNTNVDINSSSFNSVFMQAF